MSDTNKNCNMHEALVSYLYSETTPEEGRRVEAHLTECSTCNQELAAFGDVRGMLQQWQIDDMPVVRVVTEPRRPALSLLKELFSITPIWAKAVGAMAMAMLVLAVMGAEVNIGRGGFSARVDLLRQGRTAEPVGSTYDSNTDFANPVNLEQVRALVDSMIVGRERQQSEDIKAQLVGLELQVSNMRSAELAKLTQRIQDHQARLKTIEQDIDRREGLDLTDILFSEMTSKPGRGSLTQGGGD